MVTMAHIQAHHDEILRLAEKYGAYSVRMFGSVARGESDETSDLDILVRMSPDRSLVDRIMLIQDLQDLLHISVDVVNEQALHKEIRDEVLAEAVAL